MSNGYHEGLACEHAYLVGPPCDEAATWITPLGCALCTPHFDEWARGNSRAVGDARRITP